MLVVRYRGGQRLSASHFIFADNTHVHAKSCIHGPNMSLMDLEHTPCTQLHPHATTTLKHVETTLRARWRPTSSESCLRLSCAAFGMLWTHGYSSPKPARQHGRSLRRTGTLASPRSEAHQYTSKSYATTICPFPRKRPLALTESHQFRKRFVDDKHWIDDQIVRLPTQLNNPPPPTHDS